MKTNVITIRISGILSVLSLAIVLFIRNKTVYDILLSIFGSSFLTLLLSIAGYKIEKRRILENFYKSIKKYIRYWSTYDSNDSLKDKCHYFVNFYMKDFPDIGLSYSEIYFLNDKNDNDRKYIYNKIYMKCFKLIELIQSHYWHFKWYLDGSGKRDEAIEKYINEIEAIMLDIEEGNVCTSVMPKITDELQEELNGRYYEIMYGKKNNKDN